MMIPRRWSRELLIPQIQILSKRNDQKREHSPDAATTGSADADANPQPLGQYEPHAALLLYLRVPVYL